MVDAPLRGHPGLSAALAALLARGGARSAQVLDGRTSAVVAAAGPDLPCDVAGLAAATGWVARAAVADGGLADLVVTTGGGVHLLRSVGPSGGIVHVRFDHGRGDLAAVRALLAEPGFRAAAEAGLHRPAPPAVVAPSPSQVRVPVQGRGPGAVPALATVRAARTPPDPAGPESRPEPDPRPQPGPKPEPGPRPGLEAVSELDTVSEQDTAGPQPGGVPGAVKIPVPRGASTGMLAALALEAAVPARPVAGAAAPVPGHVVPRDSLTPPFPMPVMLPLPRRVAARPDPPSGVAPGAAPRAALGVVLGTALPEPSWSRDTHTLQRVLTGLRRLG